jgi:hypothetical protein
MLSSIAEDGGAGGIICKIVEVEEQCAVTGEDIFCGGQ